MIKTDQTNAHYTSEALPKHLPRTLKQYVRTKGKAFTDWR